MRTSVSAAVAVVLCSGALSASAQSGDGHKPVALVYARDPEQTPQPELLPLPLLPLPAATGLRHPSLAVYSCIDAGARDRNGARVCSPIATASPDAQGRYTAPPPPTAAPATTADPFAEQMLFYHGARSLQFFAALGLPAPDSLRLIANVQLPGPDALIPFRDATFLRGHEPELVAAALEQHAPTIYFGRDREVRVAYDSAAIRHEVSHAVLAPLLPAAVPFVDAQGTNNAPEAMAEALADYFAAAMVEDPRLGTYAGHGDEAWKVRNLSTRLTCPAALSGRPHEDGALVAAALWAARKQLGSLLDKAVVAAVKATHNAADLSPERFLQRVLDAIAPKQPIAAGIFRERGLLPACERVLEVQPGQSLSGAAGRLALPAAAPALPLAPSALQLRAAVPTGATEVELRMRASTLPAFQPAVLVQARPIRWKDAAAHDTRLMVAAKSGAPGELRFVAPTGGARTLYFQVVNQGQRAGWFDAVRVIFRP